MQANPSSNSMRDQVVEVRLAQLQGRMSERGVRLSDAFLLFDTQHCGYVTRDAFQQLLASVQFELAPWELDAISEWCDTERNGMFNYRELTRQLDHGARAR